MCHSCTRDLLAQASLLPGPDPGLGVHDQAAAPEVVLLGSLGHLAPLGLELLGDGPDVEGLEPTAASDVPVSRFK